jgi:hypothetical protein
MRPSVSPVHGDRARGPLRCCSHWADPNILYAVVTALAVGGIAAAMVDASGIAVIVARFELPHGRTDSVFIVNARAHRVFSNVLRPGALATRRGARGGGTDYLGKRQRRSWAASRPPLWFWCGLWLPRDCPPPPGGP